MEVKITFDDNKSHTLKYLEACNLDIINNIEEITGTHITELSINEISFDEFIYFYPLLKILGDKNIDLVKKSDLLKEAIGDNISQVIKYYQIADYLGCFSIIHITKNIIQKCIKDVNRIHIIQLLILAENNKEYKDIIDEYILKMYNTRKREKIYDINKNMKPYLVDRFCEDIEDIGINELGQLVYSTRKHIYIIFKLDANEYSCMWDKWKYFNKNLPISDYITMRKSCGATTVTLIINKDLIICRVYSSGKYIYENIIYDDKVNISETELNIDNYDGVLFISISFNYSSTLTLIKYNNHWYTKLKNHGKIYL